MDQYDRSRRVMGEQALKSLRESKVIIFGLGGVGGHCAEALARAAVGEIHLCDKDKVELSNINRQILALHSTLGLSKVDVMQNRIQDIDPSIQVKTYYQALHKDNIEDFSLQQFDYIVDCIDTISSKIALVEFANHHSVPIISAMGAGNKMDPTKFEITDIFKTRECPLAKVMRHELRKRGIKNLKVVFSTEQPKHTGVWDETIRKSSPGSVSYVPPVAGLYMAYEIIKDLIQRR